MTPKIGSEEGSLAGFEYRALRRRLFAPTVGYTLGQGSGAPLTFLWAVGCAAYSIPFELPLLTVPWTVLAVAFGMLMVRSYRDDPKVQDVLVRTLIRRHFAPPLVSDEALRRRLTRGHQLAAEIAAKALVSQMRSRRGPILGQLINQAGEMLGMQYESARQAEELLRILDLVSESSPPAAGLLASNTRAIEQEAQRADALVGEIAEQLQTLLLQLIRLDTRTVDSVRMAEFDREARESLERMQAEVSLRQSVADRVIAELTPSPFGRGLG